MTEKEFEQEVQNAKDIKSEQESVEEEETSEESLPEENDVSQEASEEEEDEEGKESSETETDNTSEETEKPAQEQDKKPSRASERIRQLITERNRLKQELQSKEPAKEFEGVDETGIDPTIYGKSVADQAQRKAAEMAKFELEMFQARQDPIMQDELAQMEASAYITQGATPLEAVELVKENRTLLQKKLEKDFLLRQKAQKKSRENITVSEAGKSVKSTDITEEDIAKMTTSEYAKYRRQILKSAGIKGEY